MREEDQKSIFAMIDRMKSASTDQQRERASADLKTAILMASDPEMEWAANPPVILTQGARTYRAWPIMASGQ